MVKTTKTKFPSLLQKRLLELLNHRHRNLTLKQIAKDTGLGENWLSMFSRGEIPNASGGRMECLHDYLSPDEKFEV